MSLSREVRTRWSGSAFQPKPFYDYTCTKCILLSPCLLPKEKSTGKGQNYTLAILWKKSAQPNSDQRLTLLTASPVPLWSSAVLLQHQGGGSACSQVHMEHTRLKNPFYEIYAAANSPFRTMGEYTQETWSSSALSYCSFVPNKCEQNQLKFSTDAYARIINPYHTS